MVFSPIQCNNSIEHARFKYHYQISACEGQEMKSGTPNLVSKALSVYSHIFAGEKVKKTTQF